MRQNFEHLENIANWKLWEYAAAGDQPAPGQADPNGYGPFNERQSAIFWFQIGLTQALGKYDQSSGPDGAHYFNSAQNPFQSEGLMCGNCAFYEDATTCEIVDGSIDPQGLCKNWIIPEGQMNQPGDQSPDQQPAKPATKAAKMPKPKKPKKNWSY